MWFMAAMGSAHGMITGMPCTGLLIPGGRPDLLTLLPIGFGLMFLANLVLQRDLQRRCGSHAGRPVGLRILWL